MGAGALRWRIKQFGLKDIYTERRRWSEVQEHRFECLPARGGFGIGMAQDYWETGAKKT